MKVNKSGRYVRAAVNCCSFVPALHQEESLCLFFSATIEGSRSPLTPIFFYPFCPFSSCFLFLSVSVQPSLFPLSFSTCLCSSITQEGERSMVSSERELHSRISMRTEERKRKGEQEEAGKVFENRVEKDSISFKKKSNWRNA